MYVVDTNVLIYAVNTAATHHAAARGWLTGALNSGETVGFTWVSLLGFVRLTTNPSIMPRPLDVSAAMAVVEAWTVPANAVVAMIGAVERLARVVRVTHRDDHRLRIEQRDDRVHALAQSLKETREN